MKVTVMSPAVATAAGFTSDKVPNAWVVLAPDGAYYGPSFDWAKEFAYSYNLPVSFL